MCIAASYPRGAGFCKTTPQSLIITPSLVLSQKSIFFLSSFPKKKILHTLFHLRKQLICKGRKEGRGYDTVRLSYFHPAAYESVGLQGMRNC